MPGSNSSRPLSTQSTCQELPCNHWNDFRGHRDVTVREEFTGGATASRLVFQFYQGMDKDFDTSTFDFTHTATFTVPHDTTTRTDDNWLAGRVAASQLFDDETAGSELSADVTTYHVSVTATDPDETTTKARFVAADKVLGYFDGTTESTETRYFYDSHPPVPQRRKTTDPARERSQGRTAPTGTSGAAVNWLRTGHLGNRAAHAGAHRAAPILVRHGD